MIAFPNAKINLGLRVLRKLENGYHEIESCFYPVPDLCDILEIVPSTTFSFQTTGLPITGDSNNNLIVRAYQLLQAKYDLPPVSIHLHKVIPMGAGLGGGSSDAAFALKMLNELFQLQCSTEQLEEYAAALGSDCPFFVKNVAAIGSGTGTALAPVDLSLNNYEIRFIHPGVHVSTAEAYSMIMPNAANKGEVTKLLMTPVSSWKGILTNDFEGVMRQKYPAIDTAVKSLLNQGAVYAAMTGSGSSVFGLFEK